MVKHKGASNKQAGAYKPSKRVGGLHKLRNKVVKKKLLQDKKSSEKILSLKNKEENNLLLGNKSINDVKKKKYLAPKKSKDDSSEEMEGYEFSGDISEQDIDSDDDLSLDEDELPIPPDVTTTEDESSEEEDAQENEELIENGKVEFQEEKVNEEKRTIFVGNLPKSISKLRLKKWFSKYGTVEAVRLRCAPLADPTIPKKVSVIKKSFHEERNNIHGFVRFSSIEEARGALAANGQPYDDSHHLRVDIAGKIGEKTRFDDKKAIFIGNLPFNAEEDQLRDHFADCGDISCIRIVRDKHTSVGKGFAFINFTSRHSVRLALDKDGIEFNGRKLRIQKALYNQDVEVILPQNQNKRINGRTGQDTSLCSSNIMKFKKKKKNKSNEQFEFQGLNSKKDVKRKKIKLKKKRSKQKKEVLKKILNSQGKNKAKVTF